MPQRQWVGQGCSFATPDTSSPVKNKGDRCDATQFPTVETVEGCAIVTGAGRGIGQSFALARKRAAEEA